MRENIDDGTQMMRNLASALRDSQPHESESPDAPKPATDQDILRAMLGKTWGSRDVQAMPIRKAG
jgi:hypothetical protein